MVSRVWHVGVHGIRLRARFRVEGQVRWYLFNFHVPKVAIKWVRLLGGISFQGSVFPMVLPLEGPLGPSSYRAVFFAARGPQGFQAYNTWITKGIYLE